MKFWMRMNRICSSFQHCRYRGFHDFHDIISTIVLPRPIAFSSENGQWDKLIISFFSLRGESRLAYRLAAHCLVLHESSGISSLYIDYLANYLVLQSYYEICLTFACIEMTTSNLDIDTMLESLTLEEKASHVFIS